MATALRRSQTSLSGLNGYLTTRGTALTPKHARTQSTSVASDMKQPPQIGAQGPAKLPWPEYFKIRKNKRTWEVVRFIFVYIQKSSSRLSQATTFPTSILGFASGVAYFGTMESTNLIFGLDPMLVSGLASAACLGTISSQLGHVAALKRVSAGLGWLVGPFS